MGPVSLQFVFFHFLTDLSNFLELFVILQLLINFIKTLKAFYLNRVIHKRHLLLRAWHCPSSTMVEFLTCNPKIEGSYPGTGTGREKIVKRACLSKSAI
jgi:hypothetical protein